MTKEIILLNVAVLWAVLARSILQSHLQKAACISALCKKSSLLTHDGIQRAGSVHTCSSVFGSKGL